VIFVDTSVWIDYFNGNDTAATDRLDTALQDEAVVIGDLVLLEILQGFRREADYQQAKLLLEHLAIYDLLGRDAVEEYARYFRILRKRGITIRKTADVIIAGFCIVNRIPLLFEDKDFRPFVKHLGLRSALQAA
tara:strand:- start:32 stop:433 length:402 start_codon:yes stop_codon:yes gene_type:complete